jgi:ABC-type branched-subunit amino acid transport system permease subunit
MAHVSQVAGKSSAVRAQAETIAFVVLVAALIAAPFFVYPIFLMQAMCFALFACAFNLLVGYVGLLSFGHALYFGWASYLAAYAAKAWGLPPILAILTGTAAGAVLGLLAGVVAIRRQGIYFAMITLALAQMMYFVALQAPFTGGEDGIQAVPRGYLFGVVDLARYCLRRRLCRLLTSLLVFTLSSEAPNSWCYPPHKTWTFHEQCPFFTGQNGRADARQSPRRLPDVPVQRG